MSVNLLEMLKGQLGDSVMSQAAGFLGENDSVVKSAMGAALPTILGSLITKGATPTGASGILDMLNKGNHDGGLLDNLGGVFGGGESSSTLMNVGSGLLKGMMGNKMGGIIDLVASASGMKRNNSSSLMSLAAPIVMGMVGRYVKNKALDAVGLSKFLGGQSRHVASALPSGMSDLLGFGGNMGNVGGNVKKMATTAASTVGETAEAGGSWLGKLIPLALIALLGAGAYWFFTGNSATDAIGNAAGAVTETAGNVVDATTDAAGAVASGAADAAGNVVDAAGNAAGAAAGAVVDAAGNAVDAATAAASKALEGVKFATGSVGEQFSSFLASGKTGDNAFRFNNLNFAVGSANIDGASMSEVDNLAAVLKAYPNVNIEVSGHTDNTGNADKNKTLSDARAKSVAARLAEMGIGADRISTVGYGADKPTATNDTAEGKKQNRRIEVRITKR